ncbi:MAG: Stk1 family PASTA domain-containing Ser/Thr kinase, partial [Egibacteraceae bacterium]
MDKNTALDGQPRRVLAGRYVLQGLLGQGGMADVELAFDQILDRQVAAKMLHARYATDPSFLARFRREAQAAASLNHPNVVAVYDTGDSDGRPFIVMEYVRGRSLRDVLRVEEVLPERAAEIVGEAALALHYAHERGLVHRDVKPANIMMSDDGRVKVADFGIARAMNAETVTQTATVFGTAAYISPEQAQGERVDRRSDIYALGVVLYEMLAHRPPFEGDSAVALAYKHVSEDPVPPSRLNPEVSPQLDAVVRKAMAKHPSDRYQTARELHDDLRRAVSGLSISALPPPAAYATTRASSYANDGRTLVAPPYAPGQQAEAPSYAPPRRRGPNLGWIFLSLVVIALFGVVVYLIWDLQRADPIEIAEVPDVTELDLLQAQQVLNTEGFETRVAGGEPSDQPEGQVIRTDPPAGSREPRGSRVTITPSTGPI